MKPPTFIECSLCGREFGSKSILIHERQCLQKLRRTEIVEESGGPNVRGKNKKRVTSDSPVSKTTPSERSPVFQSPLPPQTILPKIQTEVFKRNRNSTAIRPTTATLSKPKFLNPEYIKHDMSLTRIDCATAQLRLNDDENHNFNRYNFVLPTVPTGLKTKIPSAPKFSSYERGFVKLPDSTPKSTSCHEPKKQHLTDSVMVVLPSSELCKSTDLNAPNVKKSWSFPFLPSDISSAFVMKQMKPTENPFPQITNHRTSVQSNPKYLLTRTTKLPGWVREDGQDQQNQKVLEDQATRFYVNYKLPGGNESKVDDLPVIPSKVNELPGSPSKVNELYEEEEHHEDFYGIPEVVFVRNSKDDSFDTISERSFGSAGGDFMEMFAMKPITPEAQRKTQCHEEAEKNSEAESDFEIHREHFVQERRRNIPVLFAEPICVNIGDISHETSVSPGRFTEFSSYPTPILKSRQISEDSRSSVSFGTRRGEGTSSGSDCDNEGTSSGYCLLRTVVSSRTLLRKRLEKKCHTIPTTPYPISTLQIDPPKTFASTQDRCMVSSVSVGEDEVQLVNACSYLVQNRTNERQRSQFPKLGSHEKVSRWLEDCAKSINDMRIDPGWGENSRSLASEICFQPQNASRTTHQANVPKPKILTAPDKPTKIKAPGTPKAKDKVISGLVTVTFKVQDADELRTYNFVKKIRKDSKIVNKSTAQPQTKNGHIVSTTSEALFRCYAPPKNLQSDKRIAKALKTVDSPRLLKRPKTAPVPSNYFRFYQDQCPYFVDEFGMERKTLPFRKQHMAEVNDPRNACTSPTNFVPFKPMTPTAKVRNRGVQVNSIPNFKKRPVTTREQPAVLSPNSTLMWTRPTSQKVDKSSQAPETRSKFVQYSPFLKPRGTF